MKYFHIGFGYLLGLATLSVALGSVPRTGRVTDDTVIGQTISEIRVAREADLNFDGDIARLAATEGRYRERLPNASAAGRAAVQTPMKRIRDQRYRYTGNGKRTAAKPAARAQSRQ